MPGEMIQQKDAKSTLPKNALKNCSAFDVWMCGARNGELRAQLFFARRFRGNVVLKPNPELSGGDGERGGPERRKTLVRARLARYVATANRGCSLEEGGGRIADDRPVDRVGPGGRGSPSPRVTPAPQPLARDPVYTTHAQPTHNEVLLTHPSRPCAPHLVLCLTTLRGPAERG